MPSDFHRTRRLLLLGALGLACSQGGGGGGGGGGGTDIQVFLLAGQSNMLGLGEREALDPPLSEPQTDVLLFHYAPPGFDPDAPVGGLESLQPGAGADEQHFGPEVSLGRALADSLPGGPIALIKYAPAGTSLHTDWNPETPANRGSPDFGNPSHAEANFRATVNDGLMALATAGYAPEIEGAFWLQGETDAGQGRSDEYADHLATFVAHLRAEWGPELIFVAAGIRELGDGFEQVNDATRELASRDPYAAFVASGGLTNGDPLHFDALGLTGLGRALAAGYLRVHGSSRHALVVTTGDRGDGTPGRGADAHVSEHEPSQAPGPAPAIPLLRGDERHTTGYLRFDLARVDGVVLDASLELVALSGTGAIEIWGLNDDAPSQDWDPISLRYDDAVGLLPSDGLPRTLDVDDDQWDAPQLSTARSLGRLEVAGPGLQAFDEPALANFLRTDGDGVVTLILEAAEADGPELRFASAESVSDPAPTLVLGLADRACDDGDENGSDATTPDPTDCADSGPS